MYRSDLNYTKVPIGLYPNHKHPTYTNGTIHLPGESYRKNVNYNVSGNDALMSTLPYNLSPDITDDRLFKRIYIMKNGPSNEVKPIPYYKSNVITISRSFNEADNYKNDYSMRSNTDTVVPIQSNVVGSSTKSFQMSTSRKPTNPSMTINNRPQLFTNKFYNSCKWNALDRKTCELNFKRNKVYKSSNVVWSQNKIVPGDFKTNDVPNAKWNSSYFLPTYDLSSHRLAENIKMNCHRSPVMSRSHYDLIDTSNKAFMKKSSTDAEIFNKSNTRNPNMYIKFNPIIEKMPKRLSYIESTLTNKPFEDHNKYFNSAFDLNSSNGDLYKKNSTAIGTGSYMKKSNTTNEHLSKNSAKYGKLFLRLSPTMNNHVQSANNINVLYNLTNKYRSITHNSYRSDTNCSNDVFDNRNYEKSKQLRDKLLERLQEQQSDSTYFSKTNASLSDEKFRNELANIVTPGDPRADLKEICQIGEGSTGVVFLMKHRQTKHSIAVKKMNILKQQRRELLFNENVLQKTFFQEGGHLAKPNGGLHLITTVVTLETVHTQFQIQRCTTMNSTVCRYCLSNADLKRVIIMQMYPHPNIVEMFGSYLIGNELWVAMEYLDAGALTNIVTCTIMSEPQIATVSRDVLKALGYLHDHGIIHRDIKSDSILLSTDGRVKLSDFGFCAKITPEIPRRRSLVGTPYWMSPEVINREPYNTSTDIWSMGVLLIEMVDGEPSYFDLPPVHVMRRVQRSATPYLQFPHRSSRKLNSFLNLMIVRDPLYRATAAQLLLHPFLSLAGNSQCLISLVSQINKNVY